MEESQIEKESLKTFVEENTNDTKEALHKIKYHPKTKLSNYLNVISFGAIKEVEYDPETNEALVTPTQTIDEFTFYYLFCTINNITAKQAIADTQLLVLSAILSRPLDFSLPIDSKDGKLTEIAKELSTNAKLRTPNAIYQSVKRLRDKGYLVEVEDRLIMPNAHFQRVRQIVKSQIAKNGFATFDCLFKCFISK